MSLKTASKKRKTLHDYFRSPPTPEGPSRSKREVSARTSSRTPACPISSVPGLSMHEDFITRAEEASLLRFLDAQPWRTDLSRRTMHYGGTYCLMPPRDASPAARKRSEANIITAPDMPVELGLVIERMISCGLCSATERPEFCIVNEYLPGQGISAHVENFRFDEPVCSLTLAAGDHMRFHELGEEHDGSVRSGRAGTAPRTGLRQDVWLERRSLVILRGEARSKWQHEIVRGRKSGRADNWRRVSLTFRVEKTRVCRKAE